MLRRNESLLLIVDVQAGLARAVHDAAASIARLGLLLRAAAVLDVPVIVSEQYPKGLGPTDPRLLPLPDGTTVLPKLAFSCWREPELRAALEQAGRRQIVVAGMETHVCVLQTALDLQDAGFAVHLAADASGSRREADRALAHARLRDRGIAVVGVEMVVFEWLERAAGPAFKTLIPAIKALVPQAPEPPQATGGLPAIARVSVLVPDYDAAIAHYCGVLGFTLVEDTPMQPGKRWVRVVPAGGGTELLLARAATAEQESRIGDQTGGRVFLFLDTDDLARDHARLTALGVAFEAAPRDEPYGRVAVFRDAFGNRWDLVERRRG
ncbi:MAG: isochorismatase family protein [Geminicoccaceae bacterium]